MVLAKDSLENSKRRIEETMALYYMGRYEAQRHIGLSSGGGVKIVEGMLERQMAEIDALSHQVGWYRAKYEQEVSTN